MSSETSPLPSPSRTPPGDRAETTARGTRPPQQRRSEETLARFLRAAEELLDEGTFDQVAVLDIAARADRSVGAFYARFENKEALFLALQRQMLGTMLPSFTEALSTPDWVDLSLAARCRRLVELLAAMYSRHRGVLRAVALRARSRTDPELEREGPGLNEKLFELAAARLEDGSGFEASGRRTRLGLSMVAATLREHLLFDEIGLSPVGLDSPTLVGELGHCLFAYLTAPGEAPPRGTRPPNSKDSR